MCGRNLLCPSSEGSDKKFLFILPGYTVSYPIRKYSSKNHYFSRLSSDSLSNYSASTHFTRRLFQHFTDKLQVHRRAMHKLSIHHIPSCPPLSFKGFMSATTFDIVTYNVNKGKHHTTWGLGPLPSRHISLPQVLHWHKWLRECFNPLTV